MGEAKRRREAAYQNGPWPGGAARCPKCFGLRVKTDELPDQDFYSRRLAICADCAIAWEPVDETLIWDRDDPMCSLLEPCDNCAFRPGSHEQRDTEAWKRTIANLRKGASFYCHKGVPLDPGGENGFAYPAANVHALGRRERSYQIAKMRLCRGYLNALGRWWKSDFKTVGEKIGEEGHP